MVSSWILAFKAVIGSDNDKVTVNVWPFRFHSVLSPALGTATLNVTGLTFLAKKSASGIRLSSPLLIFLLGGSSGGWKSWWRGIGIAPGGAGGCIGIPIGAAN